MSALAYRLRVRNDDDTADTLSVSSVATDDAPYIQGAPTGNGASFDLASGKSVTGSYRITVVDPLLADSTRPVTSNLVNTAREQQLISRKAFIESSEDGGLTWDTLVPGYVNQLRLASAASWEFTVGDSTRIETSLTLFSRAVAPVVKMSSTSKMSRPRTASASLTWNAPRTFNLRCRGVRLAWASVARNRINAAGAIVSRHSGSLALSAASA